MNLAARRVLFSFLAMIIVAIIAAGVFVLLVGKGMRVSPLPDPNGYGDLLRAGNLVVGKFDETPDLDQDKLRELVMTNAEPLRVLRLGLSRRSAVPTELAIVKFGSISSELIALKSLAKLLMAEGRLAELENRPADAARSYVDAIRLGTEMSRGGFIMNRLVGIACEGVGGIPLVKLTPKLTCEQMRPLVGELEVIDSNTVAWREILGNENRFARAQMGGYSNPFKLASDLWQTRGSRRASKERHDLAAAHLRLLTAELALRCYLCDQGGPPARLDPLAPKYLKQLPLDPFSGRPLVYHPNTTNWLLYSIGPDKVDDGGKSVGRTAFGTIGFETSKTKGDVLYNSPW